MKNSRVILESQIQTLNTGAIIAAVAHGLLFVVLLVAAFPVSSQIAALIGNTPFYESARLLFALIVLAAAISQAVKAFTQYFKLKAEAATLQTFLNIEANTEIAARRH